jgi:hypothetical protein
VISANLEMSASPISLVISARAPTWYIFLPGVV